MNKTIIRKSYIFLTSSLIFLVHIPFVFAKTKPSGFTEAIKKTVNVFGSGDVDNPPAIVRPSVYDSLKLGTLGLTRQAFDYAMKGYTYLLSAGKLKNNQVISIVDFSLASSKKRLFILDLKN